MEADTPQKPARKIHDAWALALFGACTATINCFAIFRRGGGPLQIDRDAFVELLQISAVYVFVLTAATVLLLRFAPKAILHLSFIASIGASLLFISLNPSPLGVLLGISIACISVYFYIYWGLKYIPFTAVILRSATSVVLRHGLALLAVQLLAASAFVVQMAFLFATLLSVSIKTEYYFHLLLVFQIFWFQANASYFFAVFTSSVLSIHLFNAGRPVRASFESLVNTLYAAGTICLGGLLLAVVKILQYALRLSESESRDEDRTGGSLLWRIFAFILEIILLIQEDIIRLANDWVFVYVAIYGKSYKKSLEKSFDKAMDPRNNLLINSLIVDRALWLFGAAGLIGYFFLTNAMTAGITPLLKAERYLEVLVPTAFAAFCTVTLLSVFSAGSKALLFVYSEKPDAVDRTLPEVTAAVKKLREDTK